MPVELGSTMVFDTLAAFEAARAQRLEAGTLYYGRYGTSASFKLADVLAELEGAETVTLTSSGVAAITCTLMSLARAGQHVLVADNVYGNTRAFCDGLLGDQGVAVSYFDPMRPEDLPAQITPDTAAIMFEAPGSGTFEMPDIPAIAAAAQAAGVPSVIDNTWATPLFCRPLELGVDVVVYSGSKYISGHSDCMLGVIASAAPIGARLRKTVMQVGDRPGGQEVHLALRGLRTLKMRMAHVDRAGREIAGWLAAQPQVKRLLHPAFPTCPGHAEWRRDSSSASGLFSVIFHLCSDAQIARFVDGLRHFGIGVSWGGYESLVLPVQPVRTASMWDEPGPLVRFNIGFDDLETLKEDLAAQLCHLNTEQERQDAKPDRPFRHRGRVA